MSYLSLVTNMVCTFPILPIEEPSPFSLMYLKCEINIIFKKQRRFEKERERMRERERRVEGRKEM